MMASVIEDRFRRQPRITEAANLAAQRAVLKACAMRALSEGRMVTPVEQAAFGLQNRRRSVDEVLGRYTRPRR